MNLIWLIEYGGQHHIGRGHYVDEDIETLCGIALPGPSPEARRHEGWGWDYPDTTAFGDRGVCFNCVHALVIQLT